MSTKIDESVGYYSLLADKHAASGRGKNQERVYRELAALVGQCSTYEETQARMKAGGYYESPGQALFMDKMLAHRDAALQLRFLALAQIYQRKHDEVAANARAMHVPGWEQEVGRELGRIAKVVDAFHELMSAYYEFHCAYFGARAEPLARLRSAAQKMVDQGESFEAVVASPYYRKHSPLADDKYQQALVTIRELLSRAPDYAALEAEFRARREALVASSDPSALLQARQQYEARQRRSANLCVAPDEAPGQYTYERFFEGRL